MRIKRMNIVLLLLLPLTFALSADRRDLKLPSLADYQIVKCDLHSHTVFSDGEVWPTLRVREAWQNGLDALAITDHIEYLPHKDDLGTNHNRSYELAAPSAANYLLTLIRGAEITRDMPPGHFNALFIKDANALDVKNWRDALKAAAEQGAFIFWNHPGWSGQQPDGIGKWYHEHSELLAKGWLHGIEVVNEDEYYPEVHQWCLEKKLTLLGNSDIHGTTAEQYDKAPADHRPMTLVLARDNSAAAIKEALFARRTVVYWRDQLIGEAEHLAPIFAGAVKPAQAVQFAGAKSAPLVVVNTSDLPFELTQGTGNAELTVPEKVTIPPLGSAIINLRKTSDTAPKICQVSYVVNNLRTAPQQGLAVEWTIAIE